MHEETPARAGCVRLGAQTLEPDCTGSNPGCAFVSCGTSGKLLDIFPHLKNENNNSSYYYML